MLLARTLLFSMDDGTEERIFVGQLDDEVQRFFGAVGMAMQRDRGSKPFCGSFLVPEIGDTGSGHLFPPNWSNRTWPCTHIPPRGCSLFAQYLVHLMNGELLG